MPIAAVFLRMLTGISDESRCATRHLIPEGAGSAPRQVRRARAGSSGLVADERVAGSNQGALIVRPKVWRKANRRVDFHQGRFGGGGNRQKSEKDFLHRAKTDLRPKASAASELRGFGGAN
jgi:hypothetical protein